MRERDAGSAPNRGFMGRVPFRRKMDMLVVLPVIAMSGLLTPIAVHEVDTARQWREASDYLTSSKSVGKLIQDLSVERADAQSALSGGPGAQRDYYAAVEQSDAQAQVVRQTFGSELTPTMAAALEAVTDLSYVRAQISGRSVDSSLTNAELENVMQDVYVQVLTQLVSALGFEASAARGGLASTLETQLAALYEGDLAENHRESALAAFAGSIDAAAAAQQYTQAVQQSQNSAHELHFVAAFSNGGDMAAAGGQIDTVDWQYVNDYQDRIAAALGPAFATGQAPADGSELARALDDLRTTSEQTRIDSAYEHLSTQRADAESNITDDIIKVSDEKAREAVAAALAFIGGGVLVGLALGGLSVAIRRSVVGPVVELTFAASRVARAAAADLERVSDDDPGDGTPLPDFAELPLTADDEIGDLARAFNQVQETALLVLQRQVMIRRNTAEMFGNVGHRIHNLTGRQLALIDQIERTETDPELLDRMYRIDHLAVRLQRGADSLILLSGEREANLSVAPMRLTDVVRSAVGRVEGYQRAVLIAEDDAMVAPAAISDLTLMIAELVENAVAFSPASSRVEIAVGLTQRGFCVEIVDRGMGMTPDQLAQENARLVRRERLDLAPTRVLGLFVVGRLSVRTGATVELAPTPGGGTTARVYVPGFQLAGPAVEPLPQRSPGEAAAAAGVSGVSGAAAAAAAAAIAAGLNPTGYNALTPAAPMAPAAPVPAPILPPTLALPAGTSSSPQQHFEVAPGAPALPRRTAGAAAAAAAGPNADSEVRPSGLPQRVPGATDMGPGSPFSAVVAGAPGASATVAAAPEQPAAPVAPAVPEVPVGAASFGPAQTPGTGAPAFGDDYGVPYGAAQGIDGYTGSHFGPAYGAAIAAAAGQGQEPGPEDPGAHSGSDNADGMARRAPSLPGLDTTPPAIPATPAIPAMPASPNPGPRVYGDQGSPAAPAAHGAPHGNGAADPAQAASIANAFAGFNGLGDLGELGELHGFDKIDGRAGLNGTEVNGFAGPAGRVHPAGADASQTSPIPQAPQVPPVSLTDGVPFGPRGAAAPPPDPKSFGIAPDLGQQPFGRHGSFGIAASGGPEAGFEAAGPAAHGAPGAPGAPGAGTGRRRAPLPGDAAVPEPRREGEVPVPPSPMAAASFEPYDGYGARPHPPQEAPPLAFPQPGSQGGRPPSSATVPQPADSALPRRTRGGSGIGWPAGGLGGPEGPAPVQDPEEVRAKLEEYEAGVEQALRDSAQDMPVRRPDGTRFGSDGPRGGED